MPGRKLLRLVPRVVQIEGHARLWVVHAVRGPVDTGALRGALLKWGAPSSQSLRFQQRILHELQNSGLSVWGADPERTDLGEAALEGRVLLVWPTSEDYLVVVPIAVQVCDQVLLRPDPWRISTEEGALARALQSQSSVVWMDQWRKWGNIRRCPDRLMIATIDSGVACVHADPPVEVQCARRVAAVLLDWASSTLEKVKTCGGNVDSICVFYASLFPGKAAGKNAIRRVADLRQKLEAAVSPPRWGRLLDLWRQHRSVELAKDESLTLFEPKLVEHVCSQLLPWGKWENETTGSLLSIDPEADSTIRLQLRTLDCLANSNGKNLSSATQQDRVELFDVDGRGGNEGIMLAVPGDDNEWTFKCVRMWEHLSSSITPADRDFISAWSPLQGRLQNPSTVEKVGQPEWGQGWALVDAATLDFVTDIKPDFTYFAAHQLRLVYALLGVVVSRVNIYGKRSMASSGQKHASLEGDRGSLTRRKRARIEACLGEH